nr:transglycosylase domain-containing protein [Sulfobacillus harzensis]
MATSALGSFFVGSVVVRALRHMPSVGHLVSVMDRAPSSVIIDASGQVVARLGSPRKQLTPTAQIAPAMRTAMVAIEDHNFYHNPGFDVKSIARAAVVDVLHHSAREGASTITEQLAKNLYLSDQKSLVRKTQEFLLGLQLAHRYTKDQILDLYLNTVYFGQGADGIREAAHVYFDTTPAKLTMAQATMLAGLPQAPSLYDPLVNPNLARARQQQVVDAMIRYHDISAQQGRHILQQPLHFHPEPAASLGQGFPYPWYVDQVVNQLEAQGFTMNQILNGGLRIYTALRPQVYDAAQRAVDQGMTRNFGSPRYLYPAHQAAAVVMNPHNGHVWAIIGGRRHFAFRQDNLAIDADRSTGSAIKPLLDYAPALTRGYTQMSALQDVPIFHNIGGQAWWPSNDDNVYRGYLDLRDALAISDNDIAVHLLNDIGLAYAKEFLAHRFGIAIPQAQSGLDVALGVDTNLLTLTDGYAAIDNGGERIQPVFVTRVVSHQKVVYQPKPSHNRALSEDNAAILTQMMERVLMSKALTNIGPTTYATGHALGIGRPAAAKSGTSNNEADAWFVGFDPQMAVGVWEGDRQGEIAQPWTQSGHGPAYGAVAAGPIWQQIMTAVNQTLKIPATPFSRPPGLVYVPRVSITSGKLASRWTPKDKIEGAWFVRGTQPQTPDTRWRPIRVPASDPTTSWHPGCGPSITVPALERESSWHPGVPRPADAQYWAPTHSCHPFLHLHRSH